MLNRSLGGHGRKIINIIESYIIRCSVHNRVLFLHKSVNLFTDSTFQEE